MTFESTPWSTNGMSELVAVGFRSDMFRASAVLGQLRERTKRGRPRITERSRPAATPKGMRHSEARVCASLTADQMEKVWLRFA